MYSVPVDINLSAQDLAFWIPSNAFKDQQGEEMILRVIEEADPSQLSTQEDWELNTPLHAAIEKSRLQIARALLQKLPPQALTVQNGKGETPLYLSLRSSTNHPSFAKDLIDRIPDNDLPLNQAIVNQKDLSEKERQFATALFLRREVRKTLSVCLIQAESSPASSLHTLVRNRLFDRNVVGIMGKFLKQPL